jgi:hypothetical protein
VTSRVAGPAADTAALLRRGLLGLALLGLGGTTVELVFLRHWSGATQLIVWPGVVALGVAMGVLVRAPSPAAVRAVRALALVALVIGVAGVGFHALENLDAGPLDRAYAATWDSLGAVRQLFLALTGGVGPAPVLAPGALGEIALAIILATLRHPAIEAAAG